MTPAPRRASLESRAMKRGKKPLLAKAIRFHSRGDDEAFFAWLKDIACVHSFSGEGRDISMELSTTDIDDSSPLAA